MISVAIVEDEAEQAGILLSYLERYGQEYGVGFQATHFSGSLAFLNDVRTIFDIVFMDIEMPYKNGMEAAAEMRQINTESCLIFVTNMAQYAIKGYEVDAMDFVLKPVNYFAFNPKIRIIVTKYNQFDIMPSLDKNSRSRSIVSVRQRALPMLVLTVVS